MGKPWILMGPVLFTFKENGWVEIQNVSLIQQQQERQQLMGRAEECDILCPLGNGDNDNVLGKGEEKSQTHLATRRDKRFVEENAKMECSSGERNKYPRMFMKYHNIFSWYENGLGQCDRQQHETHLKHKTPVYIKQFKIPEGHATAFEEQVKELLKLRIVQQSLCSMTAPSL